MGYCYYKEVPEANYLNKCPFCNKESKIKQDCFVVTFAKITVIVGRKKQPKKKAKFLSANYIIVQIVIFVFRLLFRKQKYVSTIMAFRLYLKM